MFHEHRHTSKQIELLNINRCKLLPLFCQYDLGQIDQQTLENNIQDMGIALTQSYHSYIRKRYGSMKFNEFLIALQFTNDDTIQHMMHNPNNYQNANKTNITQNIDISANATTIENNAQIAEENSGLRMKNIVSGIPTADDTTELHQFNKRKADGIFNCDIYRYNHTRDFLKWNGPSHDNKNQQSQVQQQQKTHENQQKLSCKKLAVNTILSVNTDPENMGDQLNKEMPVGYQSSNQYENNRISEEYRRIRDVCKAYSRGLAGVKDIEHEILCSGIELDANQEKILNRCRIDPNVTLSELYLAFGNEKQQMTGNFTKEESINALREPLLLVDHPNDIITWKGDSQHTPFENVTRRKSYSTPRSSDILTWNIISNEEYTKKLTGKGKGVGKHISQTYHSNIEFKGDFIPKVEEGFYSCMRHVSTEFDHFRTSKDMLHWDPSVAQNEKVRSGNGEYIVSWEKYRDDDRVPFNEK